MDSTDDGRVTLDEVAMLLGAKVIEIHALQKQLQAAQKRIAELTPKPEPKAEAQPKNEAKRGNGVHVSTVGQTGGVTAANVP